MKQIISLYRFLKPVSAWMALAAALLLPAERAQAAGPTITGQFANVVVLDNDTTNLFNNVNVIDTGTNLSKVTIFATTTNFGSIFPLPGTVTMVNNTNYIITSTNPGPIMNSLVFTARNNFVPVPNSSNTMFTFFATDASNNVSSTITTIVKVLSTNDDPTLTVTGSTNFTVNDNATVKPFIRVTFTDPDNNGNQSQTVTVTVGNTNYGYLQTNASANFSSNNYVYTFTGTPAAATTAISNLAYVPVANLVGVGQTTTNTFGIGVSDGYGSDTNSSLSVVATSINDAPTLTGVPSAHLLVQTGSSILPFSTVTIIDPDHNDDPTNNTGQALTLTVTLTGTNVIGNFQSGGNNYGSSYSVSGASAGSATALLRALTYRPPSTAVASTNELFFNITVTDASAATATNSVIADVFSVAQAPTVGGTQSGLRVNDNTTIAPFGNVTLTSFNGSPVTVKVSLAGVTNEVQGQIINLSGFTKNNAVNPPTYSFAGSSDQATTAIRSLLFQPTPNRILGSATDTVLFSITLGDATFTNAPDISSSVIVTPVNDLPTVVGVSPLLTIQDDQSANPFPQMSVSDVDEGGAQSLTVTVTLDNSAKGYFSSNSLALSGFSSNAGSYSFTATNVNAALRALTFVPVPGRVAVGLTETTTFTVSVNDHQGGIVNNSGTLIRVAAVSGSPIINLPAPQPFSLPLASNNFPFQLVTIADASTLNLSVAIVNTNQGSFTAASVTNAGFVNKGNGIYAFSGTAAAASTGIQLLNFSPSGTLTLGTIVNFTIAATNPVPNVTISNFAVVFRQIPRSFIVTTNADYDPSIPNQPASVTGGTLRKAVLDAGPNDHITFDIRSGSASVADYPTTIRLKSPITLNNNLIFDGPGADAVTISGDSDGDGLQDVQLFVVNASVTMNRLTFASGHASFAGGAFEVATNASLTISYCAITNCIGDFWGGAIDVTGGQLAMDHCYIANNSTKTGIGLGGGAISFYTVSSSTISSSTFYGNQQLAVNGLGGGAIYAEDSNPGVEMDVNILNCTFTANNDLAGHGSSIRPNVFNTVVFVQNCIFNDGQGKNLEMDQSGAVESLGGNISDDSTHTVFSAGGAPVDTVIFGDANDLVNTDAKISAPANNGGPFLSCALLAGSPAIGNALSVSPALSALGTDMRGYFRTDGHPDSGAFEQNATNRIVIEEVLFNPAAPNTNNDFIEFYVPRESGAVDFTGMKVYSGNTLRYTFTTATLQPGQAMVLFSLNSSSTAVPSGVFKQVAPVNLLLDNNADVISVQNAAGQVIYQVDYVGSFTSSSLTDPGYLTLTNQSLVLSPQFKGNFLPYQRVVAKEGGTVPSGFSNPGYDASGNPLSIGNAPPRAFDDVTATDAHTPLTAISVLANDTDADGGDTIRVVGIGLTNGVIPGVTNATSHSVLGAAITINNSPTNGASITYDPTASATLTALPQGTVVVDTFQYTIVDSDNSGDHNRGASLSETNANLIKATATVSVTITGVNAAPVPHNDTVGTSSRLTTAEDAVIDFTTVDTLISNDTDPNTDDSTNTLNIISIEPTSAYVSNSVSITTAFGATAVLDIRFDRNQTHITYDPRNSAILNALAQGQSVVDTFYYTVRDSHGAIGTASIGITVTGVNDGPVANPDSLATDEDHILTVPIATLLANDTDVDTATVLQISAVTGTSALGASVQIVGTNIVYDPTVSSNLNALSRKEIAIDTFSYTAIDDHGLSSNAVVTVTVTGVNDRPISAADAYTIDEDHLLSRTTPGVLINDVDPDVNGHAPDDLMSVTAYTNFITSAGASVTVHPDGSFAYDPRVVFDWLIQGDFTNDTFSYVVLDHSLTIANDDIFGVQANTTGNILKVLANDSILSGMQGAVMSISSVTAPNHGGTATISGTNIVYTPAGLYSGTETFSYTLSDGLGGTDTATVTAQVSANTLYANADNYTVAQGNSVVLDILENDVLVPASGASIALVSLGTPTRGATLVQTGSTVTYTPNPTNSGSYTETFTYLASSGSIQTTGTVTVKVVDRSNTLTADDDTFVVLANSGNNILDVLANDRALPFANTNLTIISVQTNGLSGTIFINGAQNRLVYKPATGVTNHLEPFINYTISDGLGGTATASVSIKVLPGGFFANDDVFTVTKNSQSNVLSVLVNDIELPNTGQLLLISDVGISNNAPSHGGSVTINGAGTGLIYTPSNNFFGDEFFSYEISDGSTARAVGQIRVKVIDLAAVNSNTNYYHVARDSSNNVMAVLKNDYILPKATLPMKIVAIETNGLAGTVTVSGTAADNQLLYSPKPGFIGTDSFRYDSVDTDGNPGVNTVIVTVGTLVTHSDLFSVLAGSTTNSLDVLLNDLLLPDTTGVRLVTALGTPDQGGTVTIGAGGSRVFYTPTPGFVGAEHFSYQTTDDTGGVSSDNVTVAVLAVGADRDTNTVTVTINGVNDVPTIVGTAGGYNITDKQTVEPFTSVVVADVDDHGLQVQTVTISLDNAAKGVLQNLGGFTMTSPGVYLLQGTPAAVTAAINGLVFVPTENRITVPTTETTTLTISVNDSYVLSPVIDTTTTINVTAVNDASTIAGTIGGWSITDKQTVKPFTNAVIADVDDLTIQPLTVTVSLDLAAKGVLQNLGGFTGSTNGIYTMHGTAANITAAVRALTFVPTENRITVPTNELTTFTIAVNDGFVPSPVTDSATTVNVTAVNDPSTIAGAIGGWSITDKQTVQPFTNLVVADVDDLTLQPVTVTLRLDDAAKGILTNLSVFTNASPGRYRYTGTASNATVAIQAMTFVPTENRILVPNSELTTITLFVNDGFVPSAISNNTTTITVSSVNDAPTISGALTGQAITDKQTIRAFTNVIIADVDNSTTQALTMTVTMDNPAKGTIQNTGGFTSTGPGSLTISGTAAYLTANLQALLFVPTENRITVPNTETNTFTIVVNDSFAAPVTDSSSTVIVTPVDEAPVITGTQANQRTYDHAATHPFSGVNVTDVDNFGVQVLTVTVSQDQPTHGFFTTLGAFVSSGGGVYTLTNVTAAQATVALRGLIFVPTIVVPRLASGAADTNRLTISVNDGFIAPTVDTNTTVLATDAFAKKLTTTNGLDSATFATSISASTNYVVAGMPNDNGGVNKAGAAYVYSRNAAGPDTWTQVKKLVGIESPAASDQFGSSVSIGGDTIIAGVPGTGTGVAYIFDRNNGGVNNWGQAKKLTPAGGTASDLFGVVSIYGDTVAVGAPHSGTVNAKFGAVFIYDRNQGGTTNWGQVKKLTPPDGADSDAFGVSVALYGDTLVVGSQFNSPTTNVAFRAGTVYIYDRNQGGSNNWGLVKKVLASDGSNNDQFGHAVAAGPDMVVVGAPSVTTNAVKSGAAYIYQRNQGGSNSWGQVKKLTTTDNVQGAQFGTTVGVDGENIAVGMLQTTLQGGGVYLFVRNAPALTQYTLLEKFTAPTGDTNSMYGAALGMSGSILATTARFDDGVNWQAQTYIYRLKFNGFYMANAIADQVAVVGTPFSFTIPASTFVDSDGDAIFLTATNLPTWLSFDTNSSTFSGTPTVTSTNTIAVNAIEIDLSSASTTFNLTVRGLTDLYVGSALQNSGGNKVAYFQFNTVPGNNYRLQRSSTLGGTANWVDVATALAGSTQTNMTFADTNAPIPSFYRVKTP